MQPALSVWLEKAAAALSLVLMGIAGLRLLARLACVLRGRESADGLAVAPNTRDEIKAELPGRTKPHTALAVREFAIVAGAALLSRLFVYVLAFAMYRLSGGGDGFFGSFEALWSHWDARHYLGIAQDGYTNVGDERLRLVFFPLYPLLMRLLTPLVGSAFGAGTVLSLLCAMGSAVLLYDLCRLHFGRQTACLAVAYFLLNPLSVFLGCVYTESLFICLTLASLCLLRRNHPWWAALLGAASAFTRMPGVIIAGVFFIRLLGEIPRGRFGGKAVLRCLVQMGVVFCGLLAYWGINKVVTGDPLTYMTYQRENWYQAPGVFWESVRNTTHYFLTTVGESDWLYTWGFQLLSMFYVFWLLATRADRIPFDLAAYAFVYTAAVLAPTWLLSGARYLFALVPLPMLQARALHGKRAHALALGVCAVLLIVFTYGYTIAIAVL